MNVSDLIDPSFSYRLIITLMHFVWQGCLVALLAVLGDGLLSRAAASRRYALHVAALTIMVACVVVTFSQIEAPALAPAVSTESTAIVPVTELIVPVRDDVQSSEMPSTATPAFFGVEAPLPEMPAMITAVEVVEPPMVSQEQPAGDGERWRQLQRWAPQITLLYFACCGLLLARLIRGSWVAHRLRRMATTVSDDSLIATLQRQSTELGLRVLPRIAWCAEVSIPLVIGVFKPLILLPAAAATGLSPDQLQALITHELAHIRRYDLLVNLVQRVVESLLFFHPAVWFISRRISNEREQACDELVLATGCERLRYADALVRMAELSSSLRGMGTSTPATSLAASGANSSEFKRRVLKVLSVPTPSPLRPSRIALLVIVTLLVGVTVSASRLRLNVFADTQPKTTEDSPRAGRVSPDPALDPTAGLPNSDAATKTTNNVNGILPSNPAARSEDPRRAQVAKEIEAIGQPQPLWCQAIKAPANEWPKEIGPLVIDDRRVVIGEHVLDLRTGEALGRLTFDDVHLDCLRLSSNRRYLLARGTHPKSFEGNFIRPSTLAQVWDLSTLKPIGSAFQVPQLFGDGDTDVSPDGKVVVSGNRGGVVLFDAQTGKEINKLDVKPRRIDAVGFSPDGQWIVISNQNDLTYWKWRTADKPQTLHVGRRIVSLVFSPDSRYLAEGPDTRGDVEIRDLQTLKVAHALRDEFGSPLNVKKMCFSNDGKTLIASNDVSVDETKLLIPHRLLAWDLPSGRLKAKGSRPGQYGWGIDATPAGFYVVRANESNGLMAATWVLADDNVGAEPTTAITPKADVEWGPAVNGLKARAVPVLSSMNEDAIDPAQRMTLFEKPEDVAFVVELENVSDKPIKLLDTRYGDSAGEAKGKANSDWFGQFLFSVDLFDENGKQIEQPDVQVIDWELVLDSQQVATVEPGKSHRFLLRPEKWFSPFKPPLDAGRFRAAVRYHGLPERVAKQMKDYQPDYRPDSPLLTAVSGDITAPVMTFAVRTFNGRSPRSLVQRELDLPPREGNDASQAASAVPFDELVWGQPVNGLRAAMSFLPLKEAHAHGEKPAVQLHLQNVGTQRLTLLSKLWLPNAIATIKNDKGELVDLDAAELLGERLSGLITLKPQQIVVLNAGYLGLAITNERANEFDARTPRRLVAPAGKYSMQLEAGFHIMHWEGGKDKVAGQNAWVGELKTGAAPLTITTAPAVGLEFLKPYPKLHGLSLDMAEPQFLEIVKQQELQTRKTVDGEKVTHHIVLGDGYTLIVMFDKDAKCSGIQRVRGEDEKADDRGRVAPQLGTESRSDSATTRDSATTQPRSKQSKSLFQMWLRAARGNGNIPGGTLGPLVRVIRNFVKNNPTHAGAPKFAELLKRIDVAHDWSRDEAVKLIDEVSAIYPSLPEWVQGENRFGLGGDVVAGKPLPEELKDAPWGEAQPNGLRVAWLLEPPQPGAMKPAEYRLNTPLKSRVLFHNSGKNAVVFRAQTWNQSGGHQARDAQGNKININSTDWTTIPMVFACRLAPGEFQEVVGAGIGVGVNKDDEDWRDARSDFRVGSWIEAKAGDEVTFSPAALDCDGREGLHPEDEPAADIPQSWWLKFIKDRLSLDTPLPADAGERSRLLDRAVRDLFGNAPTEQELTAFRNDATHEAFDALAKRLAGRSGFESFSGSLSSGPTKFKVLPVDPDAAKKPRSTKGPGEYNLRNATFVVTRRPIGERVVNEAHLSFSSSDATQPAPKSHPVPLPDDYDSWIAAWMRGGSVLWVAQKGADQKQLIRRYDFTNPASVVETVFTDLKPSETLPQAVLDVVSPRSDANLESKKDSGGPPELRVIKQPTVLLPDHWIMQAVGFDKGGTELITASNQSFITIRRWDVVGMKLLSEIKLQADKHGRAVRAGTLKFSGDRRRIVGATDAYVGIWETATGKLLKQLPFPAKEGIYDCAINLLDCTPDLSVIVGHRAQLGRMTLIFDAHVLVWDGATGNVLRTVIDQGATDLMALDLSTDGKRLATTNGSGAKIWEMSTGKLLRSIPNDNTGRKHSDPDVSSLYTSHVWSVQLSPDGQQLAMGDILGVKLLDATSGKLLQQLEGPYRYSSSSSPDLVFSPDGQRLARLGTKQTHEGEHHGYVVPIWSTRTGAKHFELHTQANAAAFSDNGQRLAVAFSDMQQALSIWSLNADAANIEQPAGPGPHSRQDRVEENGHSIGKTAAELIDKFKPTWGDAKQGLQYGIALTKPQLQRQFRSGERVPLVAFFRNASDKPIKFDTAPDFFGNAPKVLNAKAESLPLDNIPLLGNIPHYHETLAPGEALGPFYLSFGLGENPRPGQQHWHPLFKSPVAGTYKLTHTVSINVAGQKEGEAAKKDELTSSTIEFEISEEGNAAKLDESDKPASAYLNVATGRMPPLDKAMELEVFALKLRSIAPKDWIVERKDRAFRLRGPEVPTGQERAQILLWFDDLSISSDDFNKRDKSLPKIGALDCTRIGRLYLDRNKEAENLWPEFGFEVRQIEPVDEIAIASADVLGSRIIQLAWFDAAFVRHVEIRPDGRRWNDLLRLDGSPIGITPATKFLVVGELPDPAKATTEADKQTALRHRETYQELNAEAKTHGVRTITLADFEAYAKSVLKEGRGSGTRWIKDANQLEVPECLRTGRGLVEVKRIEATQKVELPKTRPQPTPDRQKPAEKPADSGVQAILPLLEFRFAAQPANSKFDPRVPADYEKRNYSGNSVIGRMVAKDKGFIWVRVFDPKDGIPALPIERLRGGQVREALLADTPEHALDWNSKWSIEDCRVVPAESVGQVRRFSIELKLDDVGGTALRALTKSHLNQPLAILVNDEIIAAPIVREEFGQNIAIAGNFTREQANKLAKTLLTPTTPRQAELRNKKQTATERFVGGRALDPDGKPVAAREGLIESVADKAIEFTDGIVIATDENTKYARLTEKGEEPVERKELKFGVRVRYERAEGKGVTKVVILPMKSGAAPKADEPAKPVKRDSDNSEVFQKLHRLEGHSKPLMAVRFSPDSKSIATVSYDDSLRVWNVVTGTLSARYEFEAGTVSLDFSPDGQRIVVGHVDGTATVIELQTGKHLFKLSQHKGVLRIDPAADVSTVKAVCYSPKGDVIATGAYDGRLKLWNATTGKEPASFNAHGDWVHSLAFSPDSRLLASAGSDGTRQIWEFATKTRLTSLSEPDGHFRSAAFSRDGKLVAFALSDGRIKLWDVIAQKEKPCAIRHAESVYGVSFSPNSRQLLTSSADHTAKLWDLGSERLLTTFADHQDQVFGAAFSADGQHIATASHDGTAFVYSRGNPPAAPKAAAADNASVGNSVYHADPQHLWNRLHAALFDRVGPDGEIYHPDRVEPLLWSGTKFLLEEPSRDRAVALLEEFLAKKGETLIEDPLKRAVLQRDLWLVFNWLEGSHSGGSNPPLTPQEVRASRHRLRRPLAAVIGRLALSSEQIERLPDNYAAAVASGEFATSFDPKQPDRAYLPADLFAEDGPWVCVGRDDGGIVARLHLREDENAFTNSEFLLFLRLPDGRAATLDYLKRLRDKPLDFAIPTITYPKGPQFPKGTQVALVRRALLIAAPHTLTASNLTESIQLRIYHEVPELTAKILARRGMSANEAAASQSSYEFNWRRSRLFAGKAGGLFAAYPTQLDFKTGFGSKHRDPFEDGLRPTDTFPQSAQDLVTRSCIGCHSYPGVYSFNSFRNFRGGGGGDNGPAPLAVISLADSHRAAIKWKQDRPSWNSLHHLLAE